MPLTIREANEYDYARLFAWRNDPDAIANSWNQRPVTLDEHVAWLREVQVANPRNTYVFVAHDGDRGRYVGTVRIAMVEARKKAPPTYEVSIAVDHRHRGEGYAPLMLDALAVWVRQNCGYEKYGDVRLVATIRPANMASLRAFASCGFRLWKATEERIELERTL